MTRRSIFGILAGAVAGLLVAAVKPRRAVAVDLNTGRTVDPAHPVGGEPVNRNTEAVKLNAFRMGYWSI